ncbi:hypothetical protein EVG20_g5110 [Dentipellis fragilis]|uniref:Uncharacterized protein n=1 Tax=Dentipellis fragilis TaxID=205917 RepID=A0A4Y9YW70_9AGAM|nr:hypothetical protein EVG20_g5110 [Dentipellis fragilis]
MQEFDSDDTTSTGSAVSVEDVDEPPLLESQGTQGPPSIFNRLPAETLLYIFSFAACRPMISFHPFLRWTADVSWREYAGVGSSLALVCKAWRALATEVLYSDVVFTTVLQVPLLFRTLKSPGSDAYGRHVRSISLQCPILEQTALDTLCRFLSAIVHLCPRLDRLVLSQEKFTSSYRHDINYMGFPFARIRTLTHLHMTDTDAYGSFERVDFLAECINIESMTISWPLNVTIPLATPPALPRLRDLTLVVVIEDVPHHAVAFEAPALRSLTICMEGTPHADGEHRIEPLVMHLLGCYGQTLRRLHLSFMSQIPECWEFLGAGDDQAFVDLCPDLEHFITYAATPLNLRQHPTLKWIDVWVPSFALDPAHGGEHEYEHENENSSLLPGFLPPRGSDRVALPALQGCRKLDISLAMFLELPFIIAPDSGVPPGEPYGVWSFGGLKVAQTRRAVTWLDPFAYDSDADSTYSYSSASDDPPEEYLSDGEENVDRTVRNVFRALVESSAQSVQQAEYYLEGSWP